MAAWRVPVQGVGVFWSADPVDIHEEIDGSLTLSFDGEGYLDDEADLAGSAGLRAVLHGDGEQGLVADVGPVAGQVVGHREPRQRELPAEQPVHAGAGAVGVPECRVAGIGGVLSFKAGSGWPANWQGNVDAFVIVVGDEAKAFDFEP